MPGPPTTAGQTGTLRLGGQEICPGSHGSLPRASGYNLLVAAWCCTLSLRNVGPMASCFTQPRAPTIFVN